ncbi:MAG: glycosyltransferase [Chloroflexi bacterium]|nr:glycosyltransferase [Chloroflexota bacterium]
MRILVCAEEALLPPETGFRIAVGSLIDNLRRSNDVRVVALRVPGQTGRPPEDTRLVEWRPAGATTDALRLARALVRRRPLRVDAFADALRPALAEELSTFRPDVVHVSSGRVAALGSALRATPSVLGAFDAAHHNVEARAERATGIRATLMRGEVRRWKRYERTDWHRFTRVTVSSEDDRATLVAMDPRLRVVVMPLGIDAGSFAERPGDGEDRNRIIFHGMMGYAPNVTAVEFLVRRVLPRVRAVRPAAHVAIVGREPSADVRALAGSGVAVTGAVDDIRPWLWGSRVFVCPMRSATGAKTKVLEAMAAGLPCVVTPLAARGIGATPGEHLIQATTEEEFAEQVVRAIDDDALAGRLGVAAQAFVEAEHDWSFVARLHEELYGEIAGRAAPARRERA